MPLLRRCLMVFEPPDGGVAENVLRLALGMRRHAWETSAAGPPSAVIDSELARAGIPRARLPFERGYGHPGRDAAALSRLVGIMRRGRFDLVHAHSAKAGVLGRLAALATGTPCVYSPHCFPFVGPWGAARRIFATAVERALGPSSAAILCVAEQERALALGHRLAPRERRHVVHNGSPPCEDGLEPDPALDAFAAGGPAAGCLTVLRRQKAVHVFVDAAQAILERVPDARLAVVGDGDLRGELEQRAQRAGLEGRLRFFSYRGPASRQLRSLDVLVLPSAWEAFPISILEAMACGVPQVATDVGGTREAIVDGETGLLCPPGDPGAMAECVAALLLDPERRARMGAAGRARHDAGFGLDDMVDGTAAVYEAAVSG